VRSLPLYSGRRSLTHRPGGSWSCGTTSRRSPAASCSRCPTSAP
jgi:hypothetical protein